ncbi:MAG: hypothetical protein CM1200mP22_27180 [Dehalococcoidia bacterium]|nr:MAG: hypothetical protein CM1200mP22_27180 [Dehalococcoidia bacterium]
MTLLNHWFLRHRGMAMGLAMVGMGVGGLVLMPLIAWLINPDADRIGWRHTAEIFAVITLISALVLPKIIRNKPEDIADYPDGQAPVVADSDSQRVRWSRTKNWN